MSRSERSCVRNNLDRGIAGSTVAEIRLSCSHRRGIPLRVSRTRSCRNLSRLLASLLALAARIPDGPGCAINGGRRGRAGRLWRSRCPDYFAPIRTSIIGTRNGCGRDYVFSAMRFLSSTQKVRTEQAGLECSQKRDGPRRPTTTPGKRRRDVKSLGLSPPQRRQRQKHHHIQHHRATLYDPRTMRGIRPPYRSSTSFGPSVRSIVGWR